MDFPLSESDRIIAEQNSKRQDAQEAEARQREKDRPQAELRRAWDGVSLWIQFDGSVAHSDTMVETTPDAAIPAITTLHKALAACDLLDRLAELPVGVIGEEMQAWQVALDILRFAPDNPGMAEQLLGSIRRLPFAPTVRDWLCRGFRKVVETDPESGDWTWHPGGLFRNLAGLGPETPNTDDADSRPKPETEGGEPRVEPVSLACETARKLLVGWREIAAALDMRYGERKKIRSLNDRCEGPIKNQGPGTQPMVYAEDLIKWWNSMATRQQDLANQRDGAKLSAEAEHNYGRNEKLAPEIGGSVKKRRRDKRT
ncbi:MAG: hypothetical protein EXS16_12645 [Gemmataceae bacterium]|nr:hypothetical protein [Gemmataceae bacterium]